MKQLKSSSGASEFLRVRAPHHNGTISDGNNHNHILATCNRRRGGIEPLYVSIPLELKSSPGTSLTHPGQQIQKFSENANVTLMLGRKIL